MKRGRPPAPAVPKRAPSAQISHPGGPVSRNRLPDASPHAASRVRPQRRAPSQPCARRAAAAREAASHRRKRSEVANKQDVELRC